jgi:hypothetical protein
MHVDDLERINAYRAFALDPTAIVAQGNQIRESRLARMFVCEIFRSWNGELSLAEAARELALHPQVLSELSELFDYQSTRLSHLTFNQEILPRVPLNIHAKYSRHEVLAALGEGNEAQAKVHPLLEGVMYSQGEKADVFFVTLDKRHGGFTAATSYRDFAVNPSMFHWQSQSRTLQNSKAGKRYVNHVALGSTVHLFLRSDSNSRTFLYAGPMAYLNHEGERPMSINWKLEYPLPGDVYVEAAAVA